MTHSVCEKSLKLFEKFELINSQWLLVDLIYSHSRKTDDES